MKSLLGFQPRLQITMEKAEKAAEHLFPKPTTVIFNCDRSVIFSKFSIKQLRQAGQELKHKKAPGLGEIPPKIIKELNRIYPCRLQKSGIKGML